MDSPGLPLVLVEWRDANTDNEPITEETVASVHKPYIIHTLGWLLFEDEQGYTLVTEYYLDTFRGRTFVPKENVSSVTYYTLTRKRRSKAATSALPTSPEST